MSLLYEFLMNDRRGHDIVSGQTLLEISLDSEDEAESILRSLEPEVDSAPSDRASVSVSRKGSVLLVEIIADDLAALRAANNSVLSWISGCRRVYSAVTGQKP